MLELAHVDADNIDRIDMPLVAASINALKQQTARGSCFMVCPEDVVTELDMLMLCMITSGGVILEVPADQNFSVIDTIVWPAIQFTLLGTKTCAQTPNPGNVLPTAIQLYMWLEKFAYNHAAVDDFNAAVVEVATIIGASWIITPDAPVADANLHYPINNEGFDDLLNLQADDPRLAGANAWEAHPQEEFGVRTYTAAGVPVNMRVVPLLPTMECSDMLSLPTPGDVPIVQYLLGLMKKSKFKSTVAHQLMQQAAALDLVFIAISALVASLASTVLASWNLKGAELTALFLGTADVTASLNHWLGLHEFEQTGSKDGYRITPILMRLKALMVVCFGAATTSQLFSGRAYNNFQAAAVDPVCACMYRYVFRHDTPNLGTPLGIDNMILIRPADWGLPNGLVDADFSMEVQVIATNMPAGF